MPIRLAIVNDYEVVVRGLADMLRPYEDEVRIIELDSSLAPANPVDVALYDTFAQSQGDGPDIARLVHHPQVRRVAVYTWNDDPRLIAGALAHGAAAYLSKTLTAVELVGALQAVHGGDRVVSAEFGDVQSGPGDWPGRREGLTEREAEIIALITQGVSNSDIAERTTLSINSVKTYIRQSYQKMGVTSRTQAVLWGIEHGFLPVAKRITAPDL